MNINRNVSVAIVIVACVLSSIVFISTIRAQVGGDLRNVTLDIGKIDKEDLALSPEVDDKGNIVVTGGVTVKEGDKVSFDALGVLKTNTAGYWIGEAGNTYFVKLRDADNFCIAFGKAKDAVRWNKSRNLIVGQENFLEIKMRFEPNAIWHPIIKREIKNGIFYLTTDDERSFKVFRFSNDMSAVIEEEKKR